MIHYIYRKTNNSKLNDTESNRMDRSNNSLYTQDSVYIINSKIDGRVYIINFKVEGESCFRRKSLTYI